MHHLRHAHHSRLLLEDGEELCLPTIVGEELVELLGDDGGAVLPAQLHARRLQEVRLAQTQRRLLKELEHQLDLRKERGRTKSRWLHIL